MEAHLDRIRRAVMDIITAHTRNGILTIESSVDISFSMKEPQKSVVFNKIESPLPDPLPEPLLVEIGPEIRLDRGKRIHASPNRADPTLKV